MKKYSSKRAKKGKLAFRTPSRIFNRQSRQVVKQKTKRK